MTDLAQMLREASSSEYRRHILHEDISGKKEVFQEANHGIVLDIEERFGLSIGDKVQYTNRYNQERIGYVSHFFMKMFTISGELFFMMAKDGPTLDVDQGIRPIMFDSEGTGYSTHHGEGLPKRLDG